jgi:hypothetical protein
MIEELQFMINESENKPKIKQLLLNIAALPEEKQKLMLAFLKDFLRRNEEDVS